MRTENGQLLTDLQREILANAGFTFQHLSEEALVQLAASDEPLAGLPTELLVELLEALNLLYRGGSPLVDDRRYDHHFLAELGEREPEHPFLQTVEPEQLGEAKTVELPSRMLSTEKAYDFETVARWAARIDKACGEIGLDFLTRTFRATAKLDGFAAYDDGTALYTRGDGRRGTDITRAFERGLQVAGSGPRGQGPGEIVVSKSYFEHHLATIFDSSRNFQASLIKEKALDEPAAQAIASGAAVFFPFAALPSWEGTWPQLAERFADIVQELKASLDYDMDGVVFEVLGDELREYMGATRHHHRWQIAYKQNTESAEVRVLQVQPQTSRSGRVNPVAEVEPVRLSGATIRRATAHHYRMVVDKGIGPGALIRLSRSGEVIPKIEEVLEPVEAQLPAACPSCDHDLLWENDYLFCTNTHGCPAQLTNTIEHFFKTLGNIDGFGPSSIQKLFAGGITTLPEIYRLSAERFEELGFGPKQAENMVAQLQRSLLEPIEDWRFLAAFGIFRMGMGNCERLLEAYPLDQLFTLTKEDIETVKGFSDKTAEAVVTGLADIALLFSELLQLGFQLNATPLAGVTKEGLLSPVANKLLVFTGTMVSGSRDEMSRQAKELGAKVGSAITGKTDLLVCGEKVGATKLEKAKKLGVTILTETAYLQLLAGGSVG